MARDAIAATIGAAPDSFTINVTVDLGDELQAQLDKTQEMARAAERAHVEAAARTRQLARLLKDSGYTARDSGRLMGLSPQRISQLLAE